MRTKEAVLAERESLLERFAVAGWTREVIRGGFPEPWGVERGSDTNLSVRLTAPGGAEMLIFRLEAERDYATKDEYRLHVTGTTAFKYDDKWYTFDQRGVGESFYIGKHHAVTLEDFDAETFVLEQLYRIDAARARRRVAVAIPGLSGFTVSPDQRARYTTELRAGKPVTLRCPGGMGVGYYLTVKRPRGRFGIKSLSEAAQLFGVPTLWAESFDDD